jgi:hypothetical protein
MIAIRSLDDFRKYANRNQSRWNLLVGGTVEHRIME